MIKLQRIEDAKTRGAWVNIFVLFAKMLYIAAGVLSRLVNEPRLSF
jgi:hypothetical protein